METKKERLTTFVLLISNTIIYVVGGKSWVTPIKNFCEIQKDNGGIRPEAFLHRIRDAEVYCYMDAFGIRGKISKYLFNNTIRRYGKLLDTDLLMEALVLTNSKSAKTIYRLSDEYIEEVRNNNRWKERYSIE